MPRKAEILPLLIFRLVIGGFVVGFLPFTILSSHSGHPVVWLSGVAAAGLGAIVAGAFLYSACVWDFVVKGGFAPTEIVTQGMYRLVRNPMYAALVLILLGESALFRSWPLLGYSLGIWLALHLLVVLYEERTLAKAFGAAYGRYRDQVPRWIPSARARAQ